MKNETLVLGGLMVVGMGYLGMKNREAIGDAVGQMGVAVGGSGGGVTDLSFVGDIFKAVADKGETVVKIVKDGAGDVAGGGFGIGDLKGMFEMGLAGAGGQIDFWKGEAERLANEVKGKGDDLLNAGKDLVNVDLSISERMRGWAKDVGDGSWGVVTGLLEGFFIDGVWKSGVWLGEKSATWTANEFQMLPGQKNNPGYISSPSDSSGGSSNFVNLINSAKNVNPFQTSSGSVKNNRKSESSVAKMRQAGVDYIKKNPNSPFNPDGTWK